VAGPDPQGGNHTVKVADPSGLRSEASRADDGSVSVIVAGATGIGRPGESRAAHTLRDRLASAGYDVQVTEGDDARGIDRRLVVNGQTFVLQITIAPQETDFWRDANFSSAARQVSQAHAASWLRNAVMRKSNVPATQSATVVLAVDARHAGVIAVPQLVHEYLAHYPTPVLEFGFASVWVVGPTSDYCCRLGEGRLQGAAPVGAVAALGQSTES